MADVSGNAGRGHPRKAYSDLIGEVLQTGRMRSTRNRRACMTRCMDVDKAKGVCKDRSRCVLWFLPTSMGKGLALCMCMYVYRLARLKK